MPKKLRKLLFILLTIIFFRY